MSNHKLAVENQYQNLYGITIDKSRNNLFDKLGLTRLRDGYFAEGETCPQERFAFVANQFASNPEHAQRLYDYASKHWLSFSTPILSFGRNKKRALPISCYLSHLTDTSEGLVNTQSETNWLSMGGGGVGVHVKIRSTDGKLVDGKYVGGKSVGVMPHLKTYDANCLAYRQGTTRRGSFAMFLDIDHPDIVQFIEMRKPTGDINSRCLNLNHGVNISDKFMEIIERCMLDPDADDSWELKQPHNGEVTDVVSAKELWMNIMNTRMQTGEPYIVFIDRMNEGLPQYQKDLGLQINGSNLCVEIALATSAERTAVCCLSSLNLEYYDEWKDDTQFIHDTAEMLDNVLTYFINNAPSYMQRASFSAMRERSIGVGALGFHSYLQKRMIPFESALAKSVNMQIFSHIKEEMDKANKRLAEERGSCPDAESTGLPIRFSHTMAIAPNASSSIICGNTSPSVEPYAANTYRQDTDSGAYVTRNKYLDKIIRESGKDYDEVWASIEAANGSCQHLDWLDDFTKDVFKTSMEIDQRWIIDLAADRQKFIDQSQSINLFFLPDTSVKYLHAVHFSAWKKGLKTLYYCRSQKIKSAGNISSQIERKRIEDEIDLNDVVNNEECLACQ